jgi:hypothetical protein
MQEAGKGDALRAAVGAPPPPGLVDRLESAQIEKLAKLVRDARQSQSEALERAGDDALRHVPRLLRKAVERILR